MDQLLSAQTKRITLVVLAVALVALAGCSTGDSTGDTPTPNETLTDATDTPTPEPTIEPTPTPEPTPEPDPVRDVDPDELASSHSSIVNASSSLTSGQQVVFEQQIDGNTSTLVSSVAAYYDFENRVGLQNNTEMIRGPGRTVGGTSETYTVGNETFSRTNTSRLSEPRFNYGKEPYNESTDPTPVGFVNVGWVTLYQDWNASLESQGETEFRGQTVTEYEAVGTGDLPVLTERLNDSFSEFETANATVYVTDDGLVTYTLVEVSGDATSGGSLSATLQYSVTDVNATTVEEPDWTDQVNTTG